MFTCNAVTEPGVPYNVTVRAGTAAELGESVSIVVFAVQHGKIEQTAEDYVQGFCCVVFIQRVLYVVHSYNPISMSVFHIYTRVPLLILIACLHQFICFIAHPAPTVQVSNVKVEWVNNNRAALVSWTPLTLHQARGFPVYFVTYQPSLQVGRVVCAVNAVNTTNSSVLIGDLDPATEYTFSVDVGTAGGDLRGTLCPGE